MTAALDVYEAIRDELDSNACTQSQWAYLKFCYTEPKRFEKSVFHFLRYGKSEALFEDYLTLLTKRSIISRSIKKKWNESITGPVHFQNLMWEADYLLSYVMRREEYDKSLEIHNLKRTYLDYEDSKYVVSYPQTVMDIFKEGEAQKNNLMTMYEEICYGIRDVGIVRDKGSKKSLIIFEVEHADEICELRGENNRLFAPSSDELTFFINYMKEKAFHFSDLYKLIYTREFSPEEYSWQDDLKELLFMEDEDFSQSIGGYIWHSMRGR